MTTVPPTDWKSRTVFPWPLTEFDSFVLADHHLVRGLSVRNRHPGIGTPLGAVTRATGTHWLAHAIPCTVLLRVESGSARLEQGKVRASLELYSAFDTEDRILNALLGIDGSDSARDNLEAETVALRAYACVEALPSVRRVVFISTPHRGSYLATGLARRLARRLVSLPAKVAQPARELAALAERLDLPKELRGTPTSIDSMSPQNPVLLALVEIPLAPHVTGHSIIPVLGEGDYREGKDGRPSLAL